MATRNLKIESLQQGTPLELLSDSYFRGLYELYDLLWNRQEDILASQTAMVPNLPYGYINFDQSTPTATLPSSFGTLPEPYTYDNLNIPVDSHAILPANERSLKKILIRPCYREILKGLELDDCNAVIVGQPGTGKSCLLAYILAERLSKQQPTLLQLDEMDLYSFTEAGATRFSPKSDIDLNVPRDTWLLIDCSESMQYIPKVLPSLYRCPNLKVVLVVSSTNNLHKTWRKLESANEFWTEVYSWEELYVIGCTGLSMPSIPSDKLAFSHLKYGFNPSVCMRMASSAARDTMLHNDIQDELGAWGYPYSLDAVKSMIATLPPSDPKSNRISVPCSAYLLRRSSEQLLAYTIGTISNPRWEVISVIPRLFETWALRKLCGYTGNCLNIMPQVQDYSGQLWISGTTPFADLENFKRVVMGSTFNMPLVPNTCPFPVDAVILDTNNYTYWLILFSTGRDRWVDGKAIEELPMATYRRQTLSWRFMLVVPQKCELAEQIKIEIGGVDRSDSKFQNITQHLLRI